MHIYSLSLFVTLPCGWRRTAWTARWWRNRIYTFQFIAQASWKRFSSSTFLQIFKVYSDHDTLNSCCALYVRQCSASRQIHDQTFRNYSHTVSIIFLLRLRSLPHPGFRWLVGEYLRRDLRSDVCNREYGYMVLCTLVISIWYLILLWFPLFSDLL